MTGRMNDSANLIATVPEAFVQVASFLEICHRTVMSLQRPSPKLHKSVDRMLARWWMTLRYIRHWAIRVKIEESLHQPLPLQRTFWFSIAWRQWQNHGCLLKAHDRSSIILYPHQVKKMWAPRPLQACLCSLTFACGRRKGCPALLPQANREHQHRNQTNSVQSSWKMLCQLCSHATLTYLSPLLSLNASFS